MVAMLISIAVAAIWMTAALPSWRQQAIREKEAELVFRGEQYARAIYLYRMRNNGALPQTIEQLVDGRFLRKKYLDPITGKEFLPAGGAQAQQGRGGAPAPFAQAGIVGVRSQSNEPSILIYYNANVYSQWAFDWPMASQRAGALPGAVGEREGGPGGRGRRGVAPERGRGGAPRGGRGGLQELMPIVPGRGFAPAPGGGGRRGQ